MSEEHLKILQEKVQQLVKEYNTLKKENAALKKELVKSNARLNERNDAAELLQQKMDGLNVSSQVWNEEDKIKLKKRIDSYLKEIDKCLQILNQ